MKVIRGFVIPPRRLVLRSTKRRDSRKNYDRNSNRRIERAAKEG